MGASPGDLGFLVECLCFNSSFLHRRWKTSLTYFWDHLASISTHPKERLGVMESLFTHSHHSNDDQHDWFKMTRYYSALYLIILQAQIHATFISTMRTTFD